MKRKNRIFLLFSVLFLAVLACSAPGAISSYFETVNINVISPTENFRITKEGSIAYVDLQIIYEGTQESKIAIIEINGVPYNCTLYRSTEQNPVINYCGQFPIDKLGEQRIIVKVQKGNDLVVVPRSFTWQPYNGWEKLAMFLSGGDVTVGLLIICLIILVVLTALVMYMTNSSWQGVVIIVWISTTVMGIGFYMYGAPEALKALNYILGFWVTITVLAVILILGSRAIDQGYEIDTGTHVSAFSIGENGKRIEGSVIKNPRIGPAKNSGDPSIALINTVGDVGSQMNDPRGNLRQLQSGTTNKYESAVDGEIKYETIEPTGLAGLVNGLFRKKKK